MHRPLEGRRGRTGVAPLARFPRADVVGVRVRPVTTVVLAPPMATIFEVTGRVAARDTVLPPIYGVAPRPLGIMIAGAAPAETTPAHEASDKTVPFGEGGKVTIPACAIVAIMPQKTKTTFDTSVTLQEVKVTPWPPMGSVPSVRQKARRRSVASWRSAVTCYVAFHG